MKNQTKFDRKNEVFKAKIRKAKIAKLNAAYVLKTVKTENGFFDKIAVLNR